ncbi:MAG TPA: hypothetical protein PKN04_15520 [bacterium]|jgi:hypothetical protein|nr:hypothetical protein [bacterium]HNT67193.1 hypothetical protein [bacterium]HOX87186.1 hypothetical protein [bacterium]HPG46645.1 hypothetical protein [bacterium]HPM98822.1 hypothetical protein [bacterium]
MKELTDAEMCQINGGDCHSAEAIMMLGFASLVIGGVLVTNPLGWLAIGLGAAAWIASVPGYLEECAG